jgi:hypothetical protein
VIPALVYGLVALCSGRLIARWVLDDLESIDTLDSGDYGLAIVLGLVLGAAWPFGLPVSALMTDHLKCTKLIDRLVGRR